MLRKIFKVIAWTAGSLIGLAVAVYLVAVVVNLRDQPPSADTQRLVAAYEARPAVADDDNAFIFVLGFDAPSSDDPRDVGARRFAWLQSTPFDSAADPQTIHLEYASTDPAVERFLTVCGNDSRECALAFAESGTVLEAWNAAHPWLLQRYLALIGHSGWREVVLRLSAPLPNYRPVLHGQRLLLLRAKLLADGGDIDAARELLARDVRFWRTVLASSDLLITKMIATAALRQHFAWGSLLARSFPAGRVAAAIPDEWRQPMSDTELSLHRTLVGEWMFVSNLSATIYADYGSDWTLATRTSDPLMRPFFQRQDTLNQRATYLNELAEALDAPLTEYARVADRASQIARRTADDAFPRSLYNLVGSLLLAAGTLDYSPYARRAADIEGMRRAALAVVTLRDATPASGFAAALAASPLRNPYDDQPLRWDAEEQAVVFVGLEPGERGEHRYYY